MSYSFNLEWDEISQELQDEKIDEVISFDCQNGNSDMDEDDALEDEPTREKAYEYIKCHFPIYF